mmetsp:Transcript_20197/g.61488  ORF Transcript_20197/g.61488 Transcript_20197/m.61488 type:complete len:362 (+) Transcript_20197:3-1088(+)
MAAAGADFIKVDSCCGSQQREEAFADYATMRDALNATGRSIFFALCGWNQWFAPRGHELGNSWRIALDGTNWGALSHCANINAPLSRYAKPGAWNDPDLLQGTGVGSNDLPTNPNGCFDPRHIPQSSNWYLTERQARAQMSLWAAMSAPLLISADPSQVSSTMLEIWGNEEVIAVNQQFRDGGPYQGIRLAGTDLHFDPDTRHGSGTNVWGKWLPQNAFALVFVNNGDLAADVYCDRSCYTPMLSHAHQLVYSVRDVWAHETVGAFASPYTIVARGLPPHGGSAMVQLNPVPSAQEAGQRAMLRKPLRSNVFERLACDVASPTGDWGGQCSGEALGHKRRKKIREKKPKGKKGKKTIPTTA